MKKTLELVSIGTELLSGRTLNTHAQTLGAALTQIGLSLARDTTIPDDPHLIQTAVHEAFERVDIVVVSGGLGPTSDDITRDALAELFQCGLVLSSEGLCEMKKRFAERGREVTPVSKRMALILDGAQTLVNSAGAAAGEQFIPRSGQVLFVVPGPPNEFTALLADHIVPWLQKTFPDAVPNELRVLTTQGIGESTIVTRLEAEKVQFSNVSIGFYPGGGKVEIRLTALRENIGSLNAVTERLRQLLQSYLVD